jgi:hypothetical protein
MINISMYVYIYIHTYTQQGLCGFCRFCVVAGGKVIRRCEGLEMKECFFWEGDQRRRKQQQQQQHHHHHLSLIQVSLHSAVLLPPFGI